MDCREFENCLDLLESGLLPPEIRRDAADHVGTCDRCCSLLEVVRGREVPLAREESDALTLAILERTTGAVCSVAEERVCEYVDGTMAATDREIVSHHLDHCPPCNTMAATLRELEEVLPSMAILEPDGGFTTDVLDSTHGCRAAHPWIKTGLSFRSWWTRTLRRPRFAWEAAYVGSLMVLLAFGNPILMRAANEVPQTLLERGDHLFDETSRAITERQSAARRSLGNLELMGEQFFRETTAFQMKTTAAVRKELTAFFTQVKDGFVGHFAAEPPRNDPQ